ncbi:MAG: rod shape-determining protein RodA [Lentisphaeria bacterium]|nr:rod shape-determining protein RodA [Lentisphaeria bacterium]
MNNRPPLLDMKKALLTNAEPDAAASGPLRDFFENLLYRTDWMMILPMVVLLIFGELFIYGTGQQVGDFAAKNFWRRHLIYIAIGAAVWLTVSILDYRWSGPFSAILYPFTIGLLVLVLIPGIGRKFFGARSWLVFGPINFQPSELAKFALVVLCAWILSMKKADINRILWLLLIGALLGVPVFLTKLQPDLGTAMTMVAPVIGMIFAAKLKWRYIIVLMVATAVVLPIGYHFLKPYQKERILVFLDPERDKQNRGWTQLQAEMAVGAGGFSGKGFMKGTHNLLGYLPKKVTNSDFIFPVIAEETGFLGACGVVLLNMILLFAIFRTALVAPDEFGRYLCVGIAILLFFHIYVNIAMSIRMCPVTGLPLPLVSYGGTFLVTTMTYLGLVHSIYGHRERKSVFDL